MLRAYNIAAKYRFWRKWIFAKIRGRIQFVYVQFGKRICLNINDTWSEYSISFREHIVCIEILNSRCNVPIRLYTVRTYCQMTIESHRVQFKDLRFNELMHRAIFCLYIFLNVSHPCAHRDLIIFYDIFLRHVKRIKETIGEIHIFRPCLDESIKSSEVASTARTINLENEF